jgi:hypothetical protein
MATITAKVLQSAQPTLYEVKGFTAKVDPSGSTRWIAEVVHFYLSD